MYQTENTIEKREARVTAAVQHKEGDRVPFAPKMGTVYSEWAGVSKYEALMDFRMMEEGVEKILTRYEPDLFWGPAGYPANVMEVLGTHAVKWPGKTWGIDRMKGFQVVDTCYMEEEEYDDFIANPADFYIQNIWSRRHDKLKGLKKVSWNNIVEFGHYASMSAFADPEVREALITLMAAGDQSNKWLEAQGILGAKALELQTPLGCMLGQNAPYDMLADNVRGYLQLPMDIYEIPDKVKAAIDVMTRFAIQGVEGVAAAGMKYIFMPMHGGTDDFMSTEAYKEFYLPSFIKVVEKELELGLRPYIFFEGKYNTRLELLRDEFPDGEIIFMFEQVDIAKAKKILGGKVCITGNLPGAMLVYGTPEEVREETKRMLDTCAPGGGFIMDCSIVMDHFREDLMDAWLETTLKYGQY